MSPEEKIEQINSLIRLEASAQQEKFAVNGSANLKELKKEGLILYPIKIQRRSYGFADYPELSFHIPPGNDTSLFRDGTPVECFSGSADSTGGILLNLDNRKGELRLLTSDFPDWLDDDQIGLRISPDQHTTDLMLEAMKLVQSDKRLKNLFRRIHFPSGEDIHHLLDTSKMSISIRNSALNSSQVAAVKGILANENIAIVHGPPGTGKTTTLIEAIQQLVTEGRKVLVAAPSNAAIDHLCRGLQGKVNRILRVGNNSRVSADILPLTLDSVLTDRESKDIKKLKIQAEEFRRMALQYKRKFGKAEREQRNLLFKEVRSIRNYIREILNYAESNAIEKAQVILGTPAGIADAKIENIQFDTVILDEAGQCLEPLAWCIFPKAERIVLAGDHLQLPPTVISTEAKKAGFDVSILERCILHFPTIYLLDTQYRMRSSIVDFSNKTFYSGKLKTPSHLQDERVHYTFYDTAGTGMYEELKEEGHGLYNSGEINIALQLIERDKDTPSKTAFISPYSAQVALAAENLPDDIRTSTIDSFQGQEIHTLYISMVRSNHDFSIGFLNDHRRMNVAMTRAKEKLVIIGDSSTLGSDPFFNDLIEHAQETGAYRSAWELQL